MFRSHPERTLLGHIPVRHVLLVVLLLGLSVTAVLVLSLEREKEAIQRLAAGQDPGRQTVLALARTDVIRISGILFGLAVIGVTAVTAYHNYRSVGQVLERTKSHARNILESIASGVLTLDDRGRVTSVNAAAYRILGFNPRHTLWRPYGEVFGLRPEIAEILRAALDDGGYVQDVELTLPREARAGALVLHVSTSALRDLRGEVGGVVLVLRDCSEVADLERQLRQADKMASLGTLSAGLAHELKNPLSAIDLNLHLLVEEVRAGHALPQGAKEYLAVIQAEIRRLNTLAENFLRLSRPTPPNLGPVDLGEVLRHVLALLAWEAEERKVEVRADPARALPPVLGDQDQLCQVFLNVILNGVQAMRGGGTLRVSAALAGDDGMVEVQVADSGTGISRENLQHIFEPYFTTRPEGLGLGLAIARRIVEDHHGRISVESTAGVGTLVSIQLPAASAGAEGRL